MRGRGNTHHSLDVVLQAAGAQRLNVDEGCIDRALALLHQTLEEEGRGGGEGGGGEEVEEVRREEVREKVRRRR